MELENKSIIITGASSGIGAAAARLFAQKGANVILGAGRQHERELAAKYKVWAEHCNFPTRLSQRHS